MLPHFPLSLVRILIIVVIILLAIINSIITVFLVELFFREARLASFYPAFRFYPRITFRKSRLFKRFQNMRIFIYPAFPAPNNLRNKVFGFPRFASHLKNIFGGTQVQLGFINCTLDLVSRFFPCPAIGTEPSVARPVHTIEQIN